MDIHPNIVQVERREGVLGSRPGGASNAETHRELSKSLAVLIMKVKTWNSTTAEKDKANSVINTRNTDQT